MVVVSVLDIQMTCVYTGREAKVSNLREWLLSSFVHNRPTIQQQFCQSEIKQPVVTFRKLSMMSHCGCFVSGVKAPMTHMN